LAGRGLAPEGEATSQEAGLLVNWSAMKPTELEHEVLKLDPPSRARLAEILLRSLDALSEEEEVETLWLDEAERRERAWDAGEVEGIPAEQVMRELRSGSSDADPLVQQAGTQRDPGSRLLLRAGVSHPSDRLP
jgi:putative addiction module component (TIGR02574 family)